MTAYQLGSRYLIKYLAQMHIVYAFKSINYHHLIMVVNWYSLSKNTGHPWNYMYKVQCTIVAIVNYDFYCHTGQRALHFMENEDIKWQIHKFMNT